MGRHRPARLALRQGDRYLESLGIDRVDLIKVDVEGFELQVLAGLTQTLRRHRPTLMLELSDTARLGLRDADDFMALLPNGYRVEQIVRPRAVAGVFSARRATLAAACLG